ncbi:Cyanovirin-N [Aspergillus avenaceus]|uniref:Cyanovirin-N n=1 Tax=Aspergillus avenaceus TaxID=36643 RepID=A0A5N6U1I1_ASPAV|nr:Cyanovirin-N [Aspergillus avenaceus]
MSFHLSAEDIEIQDNHLLVAKLRNEDGDLVDAEIDLNQHLGNNDGSFEWDGTDFSETADDVSFEIEGDGEVPVLRAKLKNGEGEDVDADVNLSERIINDNGSFSYQA